MNMRETGRKVGEASQKRRQFLSEEKSHSSKAPLRVSVSIIIQMQA